MVCVRVCLCVFCVCVCDHPWKSGRRDSSFLSTYLCDAARVRRQRCSLCHLAPIDCPLQHLLEADERERERARKIEGELCCCSLRSSFSVLSSYAACVRGEDDALQRSQSAEAVAVRRAPCRCRGRCGRRRRRRRRAPAPAEAAAHRSGQVDEAVCFVFV